MVNVMEILRRIFRKEPSLTERAEELGRAGKDIVEEFLSSKRELERVNQEIDQLRQNAVRERLDFESNIKEQRIEIEAEIAARMKELERLDDESEAEFISVDVSLNESQSENEKLIKFFDKVFE